MQHMTPREGFDMRRAVFLLLAFFCAGQVIAPPALDIKLVHGTMPEQKTRTQLQSLMAKYDLSRWLVTHEINIESHEIPHSHPVLTLNTRHLNQDDLLLSTFIHEQLHWFLNTRESGTAAAVAELRVMYPKIPIGHPDGSNDICQQRFKTDTVLALAAI
jgi:hypothetical protein